MRLNFVLKWCGNYPRILKSGVKRARYPARSGPRCPGTVHGRMMDRLPPNSAVDISATKEIAFMPNEMCSSAYPYPPREI